MTFELALPPGLQRIAAVILAAVPLLIVLALIASLLSDRSAHHKRMALIAHERASYQALIQAEPAWKAAIATFQASQAGSQLFFAGTQVAGAAGQMQNAVTNVVTRDGGTALHVSDSVQASGDDQPNELRTTITFQAKIADLAHILYDLRASKPLLFPVQLTVRSQTATPIPVQPLPGPNHLDVSLVVVGYMRTP